MRTKDLDIACSTNRGAINDILKVKTNKSNTWIKVTGYPQNMMRNVARYNARTPHQIILDIDIVPSPKMYEAITPFLSTLADSNRTNIFVIPTYEVSDKVEFPRTKNDLVKLTKKAKAQPFHKDIYSPNQNATNFPK